MPVVLHMRVHVPLLQSPYWIGNLSLFLRLSGPMRRVGGSSERGVGQAGPGQARLVAWDSGVFALQDTWNAAETEGRVLIGTLSALCQGNRARGAKRKRLIPLQHNESVYRHTAVPVLSLLVNCGM
ncbi:Hypothetical predicted protein [Scomber scombrus]|uniref:Uncharacterized protein n=1 Tax=Scomber scombrus TaxID=13677 RepID=A0AAV1NAW3_SCOSC